MEHPDLSAAEGEFLELLEPAGPEVSRLFDFAVGFGAAWGRRADFDAGFDEVARFEHQRASVDSSGDCAAGGDGEAAEGLKFALEFSSEDDVFDHAQLPLQD